MGTLTCSEGRLPQGKFEQSPWAEEIAFMAVLKKMDRDGGWGVDEVGI